MLGPTVTLHLNVEGMKFAMVEAIGTYAADLQLQVDEVCRETIRNFDFRTTIQQHIHGELKRAVERAVTDAIHAVSYTPEFKAIVAAKVQEELQIR